MKPTRRGAAVASALFVLTIPTTTTLWGQVAIRGKTIYTVSGATIEDGMVIVRDGKIAAVGQASDLNVPAGFRVLDAAVVTPGLVDAHSVVGLAGQFNYEHDQDQLERSDPIQPELRAIDAYNPRERLVEWVRSFGVTTVQTGHAPGQLVSGQLMIVKTRGSTIEDALVKAPSAVAVTLASTAQRTDGQSPGTRGKMMSLLRQRLIDARRYLDERKPTPANESDDEENPQPNLESENAPPPPARSLSADALVRVLQREIPLVVTAERAQDIANALRLRSEFDIRVILDGASESYLLADEIRQASVPVILHPTMARSFGDRENLGFETASKLRTAGISVALQSGYESYVPKTRVVLFEAGIAAANGLGFDGALRTITLDAARILGIDDRVGSIAVGKDGDLALYDGDPFEYTTHCVGVVIEGEVVSDVTR